MDIKLLMEYITYISMIVLGIFVLWIIKRKTKLPTYSDLRKRLEGLQEVLNLLMDSTTQSSTSGYDFVKQIAKCLYSVDKLVYTVTLMAEKERDGDLDNIAKTLEGIRNNLSPYKFKIKRKEDLSGLMEASRLLANILTAMDMILERDKDIYAKRAR